MPKIKVGYATPERQIEIPLEVARDCTVAVAIRRSGILAQFPEINLSSCSIGVWNQKVALDDLVNAGDRIEIYRPLKIDPKELRLRRAKKIS